MSGVYGAIAIFRLPIVVNQTIRKRRGRPYARTNCSTESRCGSDRPEYRKRYHYRDPCGRPLCYGFQGIDESHEISPIVVSVLVTPAQSPQQR